MDLGLPASLTRLTVQYVSVTGMADLEWVLHEAAKCIRGGAQLRSLTYTKINSSYPEPEGVPWGASSDAHYQKLGEQLSSVKDLSVCGSGPTLLSAIGAVACSAPSLIRLKLYNEGRHGMELPPICSASLSSITGLYNLNPHAPPPPVILTFLPGCTQLRDVRVQFYDRPGEGASVNIRCHCNSQSCIVPFEGRAEFTDEWPLYVRPGLEEVGVRFLPAPASPQGAQPYTVLFTWHAAGPEQAPKWDHVVIPVVL